MNDKELLAYLRSSFNYDPATGLFTHKEKRSFHEGAPAGCLNRLGYVILNVKKKLFFAHRIAWFYVHGKWQPTTLTTSMAAAAITVSAT